MINLITKSFKFTQSLKPLNTQSQSFLLIEALIDADLRGITKLELQHQDFMSISQKIRRLRDNGAIIERTFVTIVDTKGITRKRIAHYTLIGFIDLPEYDNQYRQYYEQLKGIKYFSAI